MRVFGGSDEKEKIIELSEQKRAELKRLIIRSLAELAIYEATMWFDNEQVLVARFPYGVFFRGWDWCYLCTCCNALISRSCVLF